MSADLVKWRKRLKSDSGSIEKRKSTGPEAPRDLVVRCLSFSSSARWVG